MRILNAVEHIRAHPELYLPEGRPDSASLARRLAGDAFFLGATFAGILSSNGWWFVVADKDWLGVSTGETADASRIVPFPEAGPNAVRTEALLSAFAEEVVAFDYDKARTLKGLKGDDAAAASAVKSFHDAIYPHAPAKWPPDWLTKPKMVIAFRVAERGEGQH